MNSTHSVTTVKFDLAEYSVFGTMLGICVVSGIYFGCCKGGQDTISGYLLGSKNMGTIPISASLIASYISGVSALGFPPEVYMYGLEVIVTNITNIFVALLTSLIFLPVFYKLQVVSLYEYLELRFSYKVRIIASFLNALTLVTYIPVIIYAPALAFNQVSGINVHIITLTLCALCTFYTALGGLKAVVWTDTVQCAFMFCSTAVISCLGLQKAGSISKVIDVLREGDRLNIFVMDPDPTLRMSFWSITVGLTFTWTAQVAITPGVVQRFISLPSYKKAQKSLLIMTIGVIFLVSSTIIQGAVMYTVYSSCDPLTVKEVKRPDQIFPYFVLDVVGHIPGFTGLFIAGLVSASLSTMSTSLNIVAGTVFEDFLSPWLSQEFKNAHAPKIMRLIVVIGGIICSLMIFVIENLGQIFEMATSFAGVTTGTALGIFTLGILFPCGNSIGALLGGLVSLAFMIWIFVGNQIAIGKGLINYATKPLRTDGCINNPITVINSTIESFSTVSPPPDTTGEVFFLYKISLFYYGLIGCFVVLIVGIPISLCTRKKDPPRIHPDLFVPWIQQFVMLPEVSSNLPLTIVSKSLEEEIKIRKILEHWTLSAEENEQNVA